MSTLRSYWVALFVLSFLAVGCAGGSQTVSVSILPFDCVVPPNGQVTLTLSGQIPAGTHIAWEASAGNIVWAGQGLTATFIAPPEPGTATITVRFEAGTPSPHLFTRECRIDNGNGLSAASGSSNFNTGFSATTRIVISEVMANVCGGLDYKKYNQYIELYNPNDSSVDVNGLYFFDEGNSGTPDQLVPWASRSSFELDPNLVTNTTTIPARGFALILSPQYPEGLFPHRMPYTIPPGTVILTIAASDTLGDDIYGIIAADNGSDTITLYLGGLTVMDDIIDTYGTPSIIGPHPNDNDINDNFMDNVPLILSECQSAERVDPLRPDAEGNWSAVSGGTPGEGPY